jgi:Ferritin-like domain
MGTKLDRQGLGRQRRGFGRAAVYFVACIALAIFVGGCGGSSSSSTTEAEKAADVEVLNEVLGQELTTVSAYKQGFASLRGPTLELAGQLRGQDQAHVDALTKAIRGLDGEVEAEASELEPPGPQNRVEALVLAYEEENAALAKALGAAPSLQTSAPRTLAASLAASHAQHLTVLRQALGASFAEAAPEAFESGYLPPPEAAATGAETSK